MYIQKRFYNNLFFFELSLKTKMESISTTRKWPVFIIWANIKTIKAMSYNIKMFTDIYLYIMKVSIFLQCSSSKATKLPCQFVFA